MRETCLKAGFFVIIFIMLKQKLVMAACKAKRVLNLADCKTASSILIRPVGPALGDAVMATGYLSQLKQALPHAKIGIVIEARNKDLFANTPFNTHLITDSLLSAWKNRHQWDVFLDFSTTFSTRRILFAELLDPKMAITVEKPPKGSYTMASVHSFDLYCPINPKIHFRNWLELTPYQFAAQFPARYQLNPPEENKHPLPDNKTCILVCPQGSTRALNPVALAQAIAKADNGNLVFRFLNLPPDSPYLAALNQYAPPPPHACIQNIASHTVEDFLANVFFADAVFSIDTASVHIACAYHKKLTALYANYPLNLWQSAPILSDDTEWVIPNEPAQSGSDYSAYTQQLLLNALQRLIQRTQAKQP